MCRLQQTVCEGVDIASPTAQIACETAQIPGLGQFSPANCIYFPGVVTNVTVIPVNPLLHEYVTEVGAICEKIAFAANVTAPGAAVLVRYEDDAHYPVDKVIPCAFCRGMEGADLSATLYGCWRCPRLRGGLTRAAWALQVVGAGSQDNGPSSVGCSGKSCPACVALSQPPPLDACRVPSPTPSPPLWLSSVAASCECSGDQTDAIHHKQRCPAGMVVTGVVTRSGDWLDSIQYVCTPLHLISYTTARQRRIDEESRRTRRCPGCAVRAACPAARGTPVRRARGRLRARPVAGRRRGAAAGRGWREGALIAGAG